MGLTATAPDLEHPDFLREQLITCIGNKRALLPFIGQAIDHVRGQLSLERLRVLDAFAGSGVVSRYLKQFASSLTSNDLEDYAVIAGRCYLANHNEVDQASLAAAHRNVVAQARAKPVHDGIIRRLYAPRDDQDIQPGERVFYTVENATRLDSLRCAIAEVAPELQPFLLAPLLARASVHANTSGVFKGFYKGRDGRGRFGGAGGDALARIMAPIELPLPLFSRFTCDWHMHGRDANQLVRELDPVDVAYFDPPYNQHPYGSNYFMLNVLCEYVEPARISKVSGIPADWKRSSYNKARHAAATMAELVQHTRAAFIVVSYNDEGFIPPVEMRRMLEEKGRVQILQRPYNTFRGSRNLGGRNIHVAEQLFIVDCR